MENCERFSVLGKEITDRWNTTLQPAHIYVTSYLLLAIMKSLIEEDPLKQTFLLLYLKEQFSNREHHSGTISQCNGIFINYDN